MMYAYQNIFFKPVYYVVKMINMKSVGTALLRQSECIVL